MQPCCGPKVCASPGGLFCGSECADYIIVHAPAQVGGWPAGCGAGLCCDCACPIYPACRLGTAAGATAGARGAAALPQQPAEVAQHADLAQHAELAAAAVEAQLASIQAFVDSRVVACCEAAGVDATATAGGISGIGAGPAGKGRMPGGDAKVAGLLPMPAGTSDAELELVCAALEISCKTVGGLWWVGREAVVGGLELSEV